MIKEYFFKNLGLISKLFILFWFIFQIILIIVYWDAPQYSDAFTYQNLAFQCYNSGQWYPTYHNIISDNYIFNPCYVNFLILQLKVFGTLLYNPIFNLILNIILLFSVRSIVLKLVNKDASRIAVILFCCIYSNIIVVIPTMSDLLFAVFLFGGLSLLGSSYLLLFISAFLIILADYTRPILFIFLPAIIMYMFLKKERVFKIASYIAFLAFSYFVVNAFVVQNTAAKDMKGTTGGVNLIMGANDYINGTYNDQVFRKGEVGYVPTGKYDVYQKDSIWREEAIEWIIDNKIKYIAYAPVKLARLWWSDNYVHLVLKNRHEQNSASLYPLFCILGGSVGYYICVILGLCALYYLRRRLCGYWGIFLIPIILASGMHACLYGGMRYHYPYIPIIILYASIGVLYFRNKNLDFLPR